MSYYSGSTAYDLSLFEPRERRTVEDKESKLRAEREKRNQKKAQTAAKENASVKQKLQSASKQQIGKYVLCTIAAALMFGGLIINQVKFNELTGEIQSANSQMTALTQDYEALRVDFETRMSDSAVEEYVTMNLGMQKRESSQTEWVTLSQGDIFEIAGETAESGWLGENFEKLLSYLG